MRDPISLSIDLPDDVLIFAGWVSFLRAAVMRLIAESPAESQQDGPAWRLAHQLARAGANTGWAMARAAGPMSERVPLMAFGAAHDRLATSLRLTYSPQIVVRGAADVSALVNAYYGAPGASDELLSSRGRSDLAELLADPLTLDPERAEELLIRLPLGVLAWR